MRSRIEHLQLHEMSIAWDGCQPIIWVQFDSVWGCSIVNQLQVRELLMHPNMWALHTRAHLYTLDYMTRFLPMYYVGVTSVEKPKATCVH